MPFNFVFFELGFVLSRNPLNHIEDSADVITFISIDDLSIVLSEYNTGDFLNLELLQGLWAFLSREAIVPDIVILPKDRNGVVDILEKLLRMLIGLRIENKNEQMPEAMDYDFIELATSVGCDVGD